MTDIFLHTLVMSMTPVVELRGAIPYGLAMGLEPVTCFIAAVIGNCLPVPFILLFVRHVFNWMRRTSKWLGETVDKLERRAEEKSDVVQKYALWGLVILVAIPLPGTGAWTGALVAALMNIRLRYAFPAIVLGVIIAGIIVMAVSTGVIAIFA